MPTFGEIIFNKSDRNQTRNHFTLHEDHQCYHRILLLLSLLSRNSKELLVHGRQEVCLSIMK